ncbi:hypothetical protein FACS189483_11080 [Spirochaetia bacterium]|nr:hypothetical protein FACS189483_11080 [Spirochaetia bacterium]
MDNIIEDDNIQIETQPGGGEIKIISDNEIIRCFYLDGDEEIILAEIDKTKQQTLIYPINTRIAAPSFLKSKYSINFLFEGYDVSVEHRGQNGEVLVLSGLPEVFIKTLEYGLGLKREYRFITEIAHYTKNCRTIIISNTRETGFDENNIIINDGDLDKIRRGLDRISELYSNEALQSKRLFVYNELLHNISSDLFPEKKKTGQRDIIYRIIKDTDFSKSMSGSNKRAILEIKNYIDSSYFAVLKKDFDKKVGDTQKEAVYQKFFEENPLLLTLFVGSPYIQFKNMAYVGGKSFDNKNGQYPDFLYRHKITNNNFIVEIKCPGTQLLEKTPYRKTGIYSPSVELSGAVSQVLTQKYQLETNIASMIKDAEDRNIEAYNVQGLIIIGLLSSLDGDEEKAKKRSFELFRNNQKNLRIMTYDECKEQLNYFVMETGKKYEDGQENDT